MTPRSLSPTQRHRIDEIMCLVRILNRLLDDLPTHSARSDGVNDVSLKAAMRDTVSTYIQRGRRAA
jgi:hypothetical protein